MLAQTNTLVNEGSGPIEGAGHNYIYGISETVIPSNGSVNLKINLPTPKGRGLSFPFALTYNSGAVHRFTSFLAGCGSLDSGLCSNFPYYVDRANASGGWNDTLPYATTLGLGFLISSPNAGSGTNEYGCNVSTSYNFYDVTGSAHPLGLAAISNGPGQSATNGACNNFTLRNGSYGYNSSASGGDDEIKATAEANCDGSPTQNLDCGVGPSFVVTDLNGTTYNFPASQVGAANVVLGGNGAVTPVFSLLTPSYMEDRNGNILRFTPSTNNIRNSGLPITDTVGRTLISAASSGVPFVGRYPGLGSIPGVQVGSGPLLPLTYTVGGVPYTVTFTTTTASYQAQSAHIETGIQDSVPQNCNPHFTVNDPPFAVVQSLTAPNGTSYTFKYDPTYGLVNEVDYPGGGWVKYVWKLSDTLSEAVNFTSAVSSSLSGPVPGAGLCLFEYQTPVVAQRTIGYSPGSAPAQTQTFTYNTAWASGQWTTKTTSVLTTDNITGKQSRTIYTYGSVARPIQVNEGGQMVAQLPVETSIQTYDLGTGSSSSLLQTVNKTWADQFEMTSQQTVLPGGQSSEDVYCFVNNADLVQEKDEYDFGVAAPNVVAPPGSAPFGAAVRPSCGSPTPTRKTVYGYSFTTPCSMSVYDSSGNLAAENDSYIDGGSSICLSGGGATQPVSNLPPGSHDETSYGPGAGPQRGNITRTVRRLNTGSSVTSTAAYDETGQMISSTDGCGNASCGDMSGTNHTTTYSYADSPVGTNRAGNSNAYVTGITDPFATHRSSATTTGRESWQALPMRTDKPQPTRTTIH